MDHEQRRLHAVGGPEEVRRTFETALFEVKRVIVGQEEMLERVFVALLADGHILLEGVPGLAKTMTIKATSDVLGGTFKRIQFTPDLVPSDLVGTRIYRADRHSFETELGPVFCNFLLADEINRAPAKVQSALLEVMQERQVTIGPGHVPSPHPFLVLATQNPIESEGTYPLPEAQVDRFMFKVVVDYPSENEEVAVVNRSLAGAPEIEQVLVTRAPGRGAAGDERGVRRPRGERVRGRAGGGHPRPRQVRAGRDLPLHRVRRQPARLDQPDPRRPRAGAAARPRLRAARRRACARAGRAAPPARALRTRRSRRASTPTCCCSASSRRCPCRR